MIKALCESCNNPEHYWHNGVRKQYNPYGQTKTTFRKGTKARHGVVSFACSRCVQVKLNNKDR